MNKVFLQMIIVVTMIITTIGCFSNPVNSKNELTNPPIKNNLVGKWQICNLDSTVMTNLFGQKNTIRYKIITPETFMVVEIQTMDKLLTAVFMGTYTVSNNIYTENIQYANPLLRRYIGQKNSFNFEIKNDFLIIRGINNPYNEIWKKVKE